MHNPNGLRFLFGGSDFVGGEFCTEGADCFALADALLADAVMASHIAGILGHFELQSGLG
jgi:hypothetical protein